MLIAKSARKTFGPVVALEGLDLDVRAGEIVCLLGANGAGKTTTLNLFMGFIEPDSGEVTVGGISPGPSKAAARKQIAYIPENVALYPALTAVENLAYFDRLAGHKRNSSELESILIEAGLDTDQIRRPVSGFSKGMRQKVGLAIGFAKNAKALLLDEPMSGLDPKAASEFTSRLEKFRDSGCAVLIATHDIFRAKECASRIGIMRGGQLVEMINAASVDASEIERIYLNHMQAERAA
ncbi:ABC transporter ATP-binding protein [Hyphobacterium sp.]|uniref:ABC transporter ATP-binding protein n=1 Tax=Hyphobacterium sp. TaxID=2004662 RepID=UPI0037484A83